MAEIKIALYGDSLALPRPQVVSSQRRYFALLENWLRAQHPDAFVEVKDRSQGGATVLDLARSFEHDNGYYAFPAQLMIVQCGVVDCAPRPLHDLARRLIGRLPGRLRRPLIEQVHRHRALLIRTTGTKPKTGPGRFRLTLDRMLKRAVQLYESVYVINICPTNAEIERRSPGFNRMVEQYNRILGELVASLPARQVQLIDIHGFLREQGDHLHDFLVAEDGHHITEKTHQWLAEQLIARHMERASR